MCTLVGVSGRYWVSSFFPYITLWDSLFLTLEHMDYLGANWSCLPSPPDAEIQDDAEWFFTEYNFLVQSFHLWLWSSKCDRMAKRYIICLSCLFFPEQLILFFKHRIWWHLEGISYSEKNSKVSKIKCCWVQWCISLILTLLG